MSCTHDCGCTPEIRDARTDEWVQIAPESARAATLTPEQPVKAPVEGQDSQRPSEPVLPRRIDPEDVRQWWLIEDAPVDPDAELVERMARAIDAEPGFNVSDMAYAALRALREIRDVTPRAEQ